MHRFVASLLVAGMVCASVGCSDSDGDDAQGIAGFAKSYVAATTEGIEGSFEPAFNFADGETTFESLAAQEGSEEGTGTLVAIRDDVTLSYGPEDSEPVVAFEINTGAGGTVFLTVPDADVDLDGVEEQLESGTVQVYYVGQVIVFEEGWSASGSSGPIQGKFIAVAPTLPIVVDASAPERGLVLTAPEPPPAVPDNLEPMQDAGLNVAEFSYAGA